MIKKKASKKKASRKKTSGNSSGNGSGNSNGNGRAVTQTREDNDRRIEAALRHFIDTRIFGIVFAVPNMLGDSSIRGPVQFGRGQSFEPVEEVEDSITVVSQAREDDQQSKGDSGTIGSQVYLGGYVLFTQQFKINPYHARRSLMRNADLMIFKSALIRMFDNDAATNRSDMRLEQIIVFRHDDDRGIAQSHRLFDLIDIRRATEGTPRSFSDYAVTIGETPEGVVREEWSETNEITMGRYDGLVLYASVDSNPNGDPDNDGRPRIDPVTGIAHVTPVCIKRKIRDTIHQFHGDQVGNRILYMPRLSRMRGFQEAAEAAGICAPAE